MLDISYQTVENEIIKAVQDMCPKLKIVAEINSECIPGFIGFNSHAFVTLMGQLEEKLNIIIPNNCYIFVDDNKKRLSIKDATNKLLKISKKNGKQ